MERYLAIVESGLVASVLVVDPDDVVTITHFGGVLLPAGSAARVGWGHDGVTFSPPPIPEPTSEEAAAAVQQALLQADAVLMDLAKHTPAECATYVQTNVTNLAPAISMLSKLAMLLSIFAKERIN